MNDDLPGNRRLWITWALLMGLTCLSLFGALAPGDGANAAMAWWGVALVIAATYYKAHRIVMVYLNLRASSPMWRGTLVAFLVVTTLLILGGYLLSLWVQ